MAINLWVKSINLHECQHKTLAYVHVKITVFAYTVLSKPMYMHSYYHRRRKGWGYGAAAPPHFKGAP